MVPSPHIYFNHRSLLLYVGDGKWQSICDMADSSYKYYIFILLLHLSTYRAPTNGHTPHFFIVFLGKKSLMKVVLKVQKVIYHVVCPIL